MEVHLDGVVPVGIFEVLDPVPCAAAVADTRVIQHDVEPSEVGDGLFDQGVTLFALLDVGGDDKRLAATGSRDLGSGRFELTYGAAGYADIRSGFGERDGHRLAQPATAAGDDDHLPRRTVETQSFQYHAVPPAGPCAPESYVREHGSASSGHADRTDDQGQRRDTEAIQDERHQRPGSQEAEQVVDDCEPDREGTPETDDEFGQFVSRGIGKVSCL